MAAATAEADSYPNAIQFGYITTKWIGLRILPQKIKGLVLGKIFDGLSLGLGLEARSVSLVSGFKVSFTSLAVTNRNRIEIRNTIHCMIHQKLTKRDDVNGCVTTNLFPAAEISPVCVEVFRP